MSKNDNRPVVVRMAPSPTGYFHLGSARTAIYNWLFAKKHGGKFILRIEDTDEGRSKKEYEEDILESMRWLGLIWDECYRQSERAEVYKRYLVKLLEEKKAFWCDHSATELEAEQASQYRLKEPPRHVCDRKLFGLSAKDKAIMRLSAGDTIEEVSFDDIIRGVISFRRSTIGDFAIAKNLDAPLYHFAVVVDDQESGVTHIIRGEDHINNTARHLLIQRALGFDPPRYAHLPIILAPDKSKLSKRHGATSVREYRELGYAAEAICNYLIMLGFTLPEGRQIMELNEAVSFFELESVHKSGAIFDSKKLDWVNSEHIKLMSNDDLLGELLNHLARFLPGAVASRERLSKALPTVRERLNKFSDIKDYDFLFLPPSPSVNMLAWKNRTPDATVDVLSRIINLLSGLKIWQEKAIREAFETLSSEVGERGAVYWPARVALSARKYSPDPVAIALVIGQEETIQRLVSAREAMSKNE